MGFTIKIINLPIEPGWTKWVVTYQPPGALGIHVTQPMASTIQVKIESIAKQGHLFVSPWADDVEYPAVFAGAIDIEQGAFYILDISTGGFSKGVQGIPGWVVLAFMVGSIILWKRGKKRSRRY